MNYNKDRYPFIYHYGYVPSPDINNDGFADMGDLGIVGKAFGSYSGHPRWNPNTDLNDDDFVDMGDIGIVGRNFGKTYS
jgi:hypothetical protein